VSEVDWKQVRQVLEKASFIEVVALAKALAPKLYTSWETVLRALIEVAERALEETGELKETVTEKTIVEEEVTEQ